VPELQEAKILIVDDDIRNIYSLTSVLESYGVDVLHAERGRDGIVILEQTENVDARLIDIMMPEMDGYETMQRIRAIRHRRGAADRGDRQGDEGRPAEVPRRRRVRLYRQAGGHRSAAGAAARLDRAGIAADAGGDAPRLIVPARRNNDGRSQLRTVGAAQEGQASLSRRPPAPRSRAPRCWWSTTMSAICSPSARCWAIWPTS
jgi:CheY-like chemotaxis protein